MIKRLFSFIFCMVPVGAMAVVDPLDVNSDGVVDLSASGLDIAADGNARLVPGGNARAMRLGANGMTVAADVIAGADTGSDGSLLISPDVDMTTDGTFSIVADNGANISIGNFANATGVLQVNNGMNLTFAVEGAQPTSTTEFMGFSAGGGVRNAGKLTFNNIGEFKTAGVVENDAGAESMKINAKTVTVHSVANNAGELSILASDAVNITSGRVASSGDATLTSVTGKTISALGSVGNASGKMVLNATDGDIVVAGSIENGKVNEETGAVMDIGATGAVSAQIITNEGNNSDMTINAASLNVTGGDANNPSFVNGGDLIVDVTGAVTLANGFDLTTMAAGNKFDLTAGTLDVGNLTAWTQFLTNRLNKFDVTVTGGAIDTKGGAIANNGGTMTLTSVGLNAGAITNNGTNLTVSAGNGDVTVGDVRGAAGVTSIVTNKNITAGTVNNSAITTLNSETQTQVAGIINNNGRVQVAAQSTNGGTVKVTGAVRNINGDTEIVAQNVDVSGTIESVNGSINIHGIGDETGSINVGAITATGGDIYMNAIDGTVKADGNVLATGGGINIGADTRNFAVDGAITVNGVTLSGVDAAAGHINIGGADNQDIIVSSTGTMTVSGDIDATATDKSRTAHFVAGRADSVSDIVVSGDIVAAGLGQLVFGSNNIASNISVGGQIRTGDANDASGVIEFYNPDVMAASISNNGMIKTHGTNRIGARDGDVNIAGAVWFDDAATAMPTGLIVDGVDSFEISAANGDIDLGGIQMAADKTLTLTTGNDIFVRDSVTNYGTLLATGANTIRMAGFDNMGTANLAAANIFADNIYATAGHMNIETPALKVAGDIDVTGEMSQGAAANTTSVLNIAGIVSNVSGRALTVAGGNFVANGGDVMYSMSDNIAIGGDVNIGDAATTMFVANGISANNVTSNGNLTLNSGAGYTRVDDIVSNGRMILAGAGLVTGGGFDQAALYQNYANEINERDVNIKSDDYSIDASNVIVSKIMQNSGKLTLNTNDLTVGGDVTASDLRVVGTTNEWLNVGIDGNVSGGAKFINLRRMQIGGDYTFGNSSQLVMAILNASDAGRDYWASVDVKEGSTTFGKITNPVGADADALISVGGKFKTELESNSETLQIDGDKIGVKIFDMVDADRAIWLLHANDGINESGAKINTVAVKYCNIDGTKCFDYLVAGDANNAADNDLPAYITVRDTDGDGTGEDMYLVFDPRFGGGAVYQIQPVVGQVPGHTGGEYTSAGALDDAISGALTDAGFVNRTPIDAIPFVFAGTNMETAARELAARMDYYNQSRDGAALARFSRLFTPREGEQIFGAIAMNEHTSFRDFEDHMLNEFIWNRNRNLRQAWGEFDFGMIRQDLANENRARANRFSFTGGYDWQNSETLILGLGARVSHTSGDNDFDVDLSYGNKVAMGRVKTDVSDTDFGIGAYLLKTFGTKMRGYGNAFIDLHWLDVTRDQTFMHTIDGDAVAFSLTSEWGLMHDWLNQYIVGNAYARIGYNFGFDMTEKSAGHDYMKLKSDGYMILTPGYTLTAQKRIYPSSWFQMRPYASIGVEYDVFGMPDELKYKFATAHHFTKYDVDINPLWANIGGGVELLWVNGIQVGLDYRYQYNSDIQMHKIKLSGSYRF